MSKNPFTKVTAEYSSGDDSCLISWELDAPYEDGSFLIRKSPDGERNIEIIKTDLSWEDSSFTDTEFLLHNRTGEFFYQVILRYEKEAYYSGFVTATGRKSHVTEHTKKDPEEGHKQQEKVIEQADEILVENERVQPAAPAQQLEPLNRELGIIQQINRLELLNMRHRGTECAILKPKKIGELSHSGIDQDTKQETNPLSTDRYGELYKGGFEEPIFTYMLGRIKRVDLLKPLPSGEGQTDKYVYQVRMGAHPRIALDDIVVDLADDARYAIKQVDNYQLRGIHTAILDVQLIMLPRTSTVYKFPVIKPFYPELPWDPANPPPDTPYDPDNPSGYVPE
jgi:hypothetical protein